MEDTTLSLDFRDEIGGSRRLFRGANKDTAKKTQLGKR